MIDSESTIDSTWIWSEGSAERDVSRGKVGALVIIRSGESREIRVAPGSLLSSTRAERMAMRAALEEGSTVAGDLATGPVVPVVRWSGGPVVPYAAVGASPLWHTGK